jgi:hypothetical protein
MQERFSGGSRGIGGISLAGTPTVIGEIESCQPRFQFPSSIPACLGLTRQNRWGFPDNIRLISTPSKQLMQWK